MFRRLVTTLLVGAWAAFAVVAGGAEAPAAPAVSSAALPAPDCPPVTIKDSTKAAMAVFTGTVTDVVREPRTDGQPGAFYVHTVTVSRVYQGKVDTETVEVQTDRNQQQCSLGELATDTEYMFFVTGTGDPWLASGVSGTRPSSETVVGQVERLLGEGKPPVAPAPESAQFTPVDTGEPQSLSRAAAPGLALILVGLLGLAVVRGMGRRSR